MIISIESLHYSRGITLTILYCNETITFIYNSQTIIIIILLSNNNDHFTIMYLIAPVHVIKPFGFQRRRAFCPRAPANARAYRLDQLMHKVFAISGGTRVLNRIIFNVVVLFLFILCA